MAAAGKFLSRAIASTPVLIFFTTAAAPMRFTISYALIGCACLALAPFACSDEQLQNHASSSSSSGAGGAGGCVPSSAMCPVAFSYPFHNEQSVALRGDFAPDGWTNGVSMSLEGAVWKT